MIRSIWQTGNDSQTLQLIYIQSQTHTVRIYKHMHTNGSAEHIVPLLIHYFSEIGRLLFRQVSPNTHIIAFFSTPFSLCNDQWGKNASFWESELWYSKCQNECLLCAACLMCVRALSSSNGKSISSPQAPIQVLFTLAASCSPQPEKAIDSCVTVSSGANMGPPLHTVLILLTSGLLYSGLCYQAGVPPIQIKNMRQYNG